MNKIKTKIIFLIIITVCAMSAPLFAMADSTLEITNSLQQLSLTPHVPPSLVTNTNNSAKIGERLTTTIESRGISEYLTAEELAVMNQASKGARKYVAIASSYERYA